ncbi:hypothetical protein [Agrobacterium sp. 10MFCol1.1]|uniref:hypothetical protein n=1 Tax=Agrobacterium sp. 10MFCol1.1 TaxID=1150775 RepID=UPI00037B9AD1|nr:hypothetical protein [Agrobacterium sp. 10MFCol1.1]
MASDNGNSRQEKIERIIRMSQGMKPEQIDAELAQSYELKPHEVEAAEAFIEAVSLPKYKAAGGIMKMVIDHPRQEVGMAVLMRAMGISDETLFYGIIRQLTNAVSKDQSADFAELNAAISTVASIEPRDNLEALLATQMATVHMAAMRHSRSMLTSDTFEQLDIHERTVNKLMRTFTIQMEALRKHRNGGNQKVVVEHVHVHSGGQAIVGNVTHGGRGGNKKGTQSHGQEDLSIPARAAVLGYVEADKVPMPGAGGARKDSLPVPRSPRRSAKGEKERRI